MPTVASILVDAKVEKALDYSVPEEFQREIQVGSRVEVPLRGGKTLGTVRQIYQVEDATTRLKPIARLLHEESLISPALFALAEWMANYYGARLNVVLKQMLPRAIRSQGSQFKSQWIYQMAASPDTGEMLKLGRRAPKQAQIIQLLQGSSEGLPSAQILQETGASSAVLQALVKKGWVGKEQKRLYRDPYRSEQFVASEPHALNAEQSECFARVIEALESEGATKPILLHGVTGSGKTEIYLQAIDRVLQDGGNALVLVPEISLTPQTVGRFKSRFAQLQDQVAVLHSHLSEGERHDEWYKIHQGKSRIVIGARSAIFAPLRDLGLIVVDEEHEGSYKQENNPHYHARDLAAVRGKLEKCAVLLGSATPSLESWENARSQKYQLVQLTKRVDDIRMPLIRVVDMRLSRGGEKNQPSILSEILRTGIEKRLERGEQTILFLNRRGFARSLLCQACGYVAECRHCSLPLTYHRQAQRLLCHLCGFQQLVPNQCPECADAGIRYSGFGTEKLSEQVGQIFPRARVERLDADALRHRGEMRQILQQFKAQKIDILLGTQMIAKGLHFPNVTLVGIVHADLGLHVPDFRAGERTFQLLTQVAGRAGRGETMGEVIVQTYTPHSPSIQFARHHDFPGFAEAELELRRQFHYPPFVHLVLVSMRSTEASHAEFSLHTLARKLGPQLGEGVEVGEPMPAPIEKVAGQFRYHWMLRAAHPRRVIEPLQTILKEMTFPNDVIVTVDVDPYHLL